MEIMESKASHESVYQLLKGSAKVSAKLHLGVNCQWPKLDVSSTLFSKSQLGKK